MSGDGGRRLAALSPARSFAGKLLLALVGTVGLLLLAILVAVRAETAGQVERTARRAVAAADTTFRQLESVQRSLLAEVTSRITRARRTVAALEAAIESGDPASLREDIAYELELTGIQRDELLLVFTDPGGEPVVAEVGGRALAASADPAGVRSLVDRMWEEGVAEVRGYRVVDGRLYNVQATFLDLAGRPVGTLSLGLPITDEMAATMASVGGTEVCFLVEGECVAGTPLARGELLPALRRAVRAETRIRGEGANRRWAVSADQLDPDHPGEAVRALAVPLDPVLAPFDRISRTLMVSGAVALLVALALGAVLARGLARPVKELVAATGRIARGEYGAEVEVSSRDEIGVLGEAFNEMSHGLALKERYRGVLDKVVSREVAEELLRGDVELGGETRRVTVLFADIRGFTSLTEGMEPQEVIALLNECMGVLSAAVDAEGGVVDKYVGDELMALFGAPVEQEDAPARAARAALRMAAGLEAVNREREARGEGPLGLGIGVSSGDAVAGNMGSPDRLNYTVLGETVNLAARLCSAARAGEVLLSRATAEAARDDVDVRPAGRRSLKGFSSEVEVYTVVGPGGTTARNRRGAGGVAVALWVAVAVGAAGAAPALEAQEEGFPTLGVGWISADGRYQVDLSGRLDVEVYVPDEDPAWLIPSTDPFVAPRLRVFVDAFAGDHVYGLVELRADRGEEPAAGDPEARLEQAFVRWSTAGGGLSLQAGRFTTPFGDYPARHHGEADPLVRPPLPYEYHTVLSARMAPTGMMDFVTWKDDPDRFRPPGRPVVWGVPYQWGAMAMASAGPLDAHVAWMNSAPSSGPGSWGLDFDRFAEGSLVVGLGLRLSPGLRVSAWYDQGPYMERVVVREMSMGAGPDVDPTFGSTAGPGEELPTSGYDQRLIGVGLSWARGPLVLRGEAFHDTWEVANVPEDPRDVSWYGEAELDVAAGLFVAARYGQILFRDMEAPSGAPWAWDHDVSRLQLGAGYRLYRNLGIRGEYMRNATDADVDPRDDLWSFQAWWEF